MKLKLHPEFCIGCKACVVACLDAHNLPTSALLSLEEKAEEREGAILVTHDLHTCLQCKDPHCLRSCRDGAIAISKEGVVLIDPTLCTGCGRCAAACPTQSIVMKHTVQGPLAVKCDFCGGNPRCADACPYAALEVNP